MSERKDWWNAALDHCGDSREFTRAEAKAYCKKWEVEPYLVREGEDIPGPK